MAPTGVTPAQKLVLMTDDRPPTPASAAEATRDAEFIGAFPAGLTILSPAP